MNKKAIRSIIVLLVSLALFVTFTNLFSSIPSCKKVKPTEPAPETYTITYKYYAITKEIEDIPPQMFKSDGNYPTSYVVGQETKISDLGVWKQSSRVSYEFEGWFLEPMCSDESAFDGVIPATQTGDITIYACIAIWVG